MPSIEKSFVEWTGETQIIFSETRKWHWLFLSRLDLVLTGLLNWLSSKVLGWSACVPEFSSSTTPKLKSFNKSSTFLSSPGIL